MTDNPLIAVRFEFFDASKALLDFLIGKKHRKWDAAAKAWVLHRDVWEKAIEQSYEVLHEFRAHGWTTKEFAAAAEALREADICEDATQPAYVWTGGRRFRQVAGNAEGAP